MKNTADRVNYFTAESTQAFLDSMQQMQRMSTQAMENWLNVMETNQQAAYDLATKLMKQGQEAQRLWLQFSSEWFHDTAETFSRATESQIRGVSEQVRQTVNNAKYAEAAAAQ